MPEKIPKLNQEKEFVKSEEELSNRLTSYEKALDNLKKSGKVIDELFVAAAFLLSKVYEKNGEIKKRNEILLDLAQRAEQGGIFLADAADAYKTLGDEEKYKELSLKAGQSLEKYAREKDDDYYFAAGKRYKAGGDEEKAKEMFEKALSLVDGKKYGKYSYEEPYIYKELGRFDKANKIFSKRAEEAESSGDHQRAEEYRKEIVELNN